jgi:hypothetical protein
VPGPSNFLASRAFMAGVEQAFGGKVVLAQDGMRFSLAPK